MDPVTFGFAVALSTTLARFLLKGFLGELTEVGHDGMVNLASDALYDKIKDAMAARRTWRQYEALGDDVIERLRIDLQSAVSTLPEPRPDIDKVGARLQRILSGRLAGDFLQRGQIDPQKLAHAIRAAQLPSDIPLTAAEHSLFDDMSTRVAHYLFRAAAKLPQFDAAREAASVEALSQLASEVPEVLDEVRAIRNQVVTRSLTQETEYEASYRNAVCAEFDKVELFGVNLPPELQEARLTDAYVTLRLRNETDPEDDDAETADGAAAENGDDPATITAAEAFARLRPGAGRLLIRGGAGCGKTTLVRWAALQAALGTSPENRRVPEFERLSDGDIRLLSEDEQRAHAADWRRRMPFVITLRNCSEGKLPKPEEFPAQVGNEVGNPPAQWVSQLLQRGQALVLIDGIDEVPRLNHRELFNSVQGLCAAFHRDNYFVITTRPDATAEVRFEDLGFVPSEVEPLEDRDRELFIRHWYSAVARKLKVSVEKAQQFQAEADQLIHQIGQTPWLAQLATTPLYCAMTCALYHEGRCTLPTGLRAMCETLSEMIVDRRDRERKIPAGAAASSYAGLDYPQKKLLLRRLAQYFVLAERSAIPVPDAVAQIGKTLSGMMQRSASEAEEVFQGLVVRSGMLRLAKPPSDDQPATVQFVHNTFKEFLAGEQLADDGNPDFLVKQLTNETWRRVGLFAIAAGSAAYQNAVLAEMLQKIPDPLPRERKKKGMTDEAAANTPRGLANYAFRCVQFGNAWQPEIKERIERLTKELFPPKSLTEAEWLATAGNVALPYLNWSAKASAATCAACVRALRLIGTPEAMQALAPFKVETRAAVLLELSKVYSSSEWPRLWNALLNDSLDDGVRRVIQDRHLLGLPATLLKLNLREAKITNLSPLQHLTQLQSLNLRFTGVTDLSPLQHLTQLESLNLWKTRVTDVTPLQHLTQLQSLDLSFTRVTDLSPLQHLTQLQSLDLHETRVTDVSPLQHLTQLESLNLWKTRVTDVTPLQHLTQLQSLDLGLTGVTDLSPLQNLTQLQSLKLIGTGVTDVSPLQPLIKRGLQIVR